MVTKEMDVVLRDGETPQGLVDHLNTRLRATVAVSPEQHNSSLTLLVTGTPAEVNAAYAWRATEGTTRPDLRGVPAVGKGQRRTSPE